MSTRSTIAILNEDGTIKQVYCHFDGYFEGVGNTLNTEYNTTEKANALIGLGDLSSIVREVKAYHRDYEEELHFTAYENLVKYLNAEGEEYNYIFINSKWMVKHNKSILSLEHAIETHKH